MQRYEDILLITIFNHLKIGRLGDVATCNLFSSTIMMFIENKVQERMLRFNRVD